MTTVSVQQHYNEHSDIRDLDTQKKLKACFILYTRAAVLDEQFCVGPVMFIIKATY